MCFGWKEFNLRNPGQEVKGQNQVLQKEKLTPSFAGSLESGRTAVPSIDLILSLLPQTQQKKK